MNTIYPSADFQNKIFIPLTIEPSMLIKAYETNPDQDYVFGFINYYRQGEVTLFDYYAMRDDYFCDINEAEGFYNRIITLLRKHLSFKENNFQFHVNHILAFLYYFSEKYAQLVVQRPDLKAYNALLSAHETIIKQIGNVSKVYIRVQLTYKNEPIKLSYDIDQEPKNRLRIKSNNRLLSKPVLDPEMAHPEQNLALGLALKLMFDYMINNNVSFNTQTTNERAAYTCLFDLITFLELYNPSKRTVNGESQVSDDWEKVKWLISNAQN